MVLCFQHFQLMWLEKLLWFQNMENTKVTLFNINMALLLCFPYSKLELLCFQHFELLLLEELLCFPYFQLWGMGRTFVFSINWKRKSRNQQNSKKVLLLCFVAFVTFVFYAHRKEIPWKRKKKFCDYFQKLFRHFFFDPRFSEKSEKNFRKSAMSKTRNFFLISQFFSRIISNSFFWSFRSISPISQT